MNIISNRRWAELRAQYESGQVESLNALSKKYDIPASTIKARARKESWSTQNNETNKRAIQKAFERLALDNAMENEAAIRAAIMSQHMSEWAEHRALFNISEIRDDSTACRNMKMTAEAIATRQAAERKTRGIDMYKQPQQTRDKIVGFEVVAYEEEEEAPPLPPPSPPRQSCEVYVPGRRNGN